MKKLILLLLSSCIAIADTPPIIYQFNSPLLKTSNRIISIPVATSSVNGYLSSTDWTTFNSKQAAGSYITALTGDVTASGPGSVAATLATVNGNVGSFGSSTAIPNFTVNAKGLITAAGTNVVIAPAGTLTGTTLASNVVSSSLTSLGTITSGTWNGTSITNTYLANMADQTFKGNNSGGVAAPLDLTATQATAMLNNFVGDSGAGGTKGLVPAPTILQGSTYKYLDASGSFTSPGIRKTPTEAVTAGSTWVGRTAAAANQWFGMAWAPELGIFCGIASSGASRAQWSRDGIAWTAATAAAARVWTKVAWSPELRLFAAVAFDGTTADNVMTSPDCRTWTSRTGTEANQWYDIKWSPALAKFLAVSINGTNRCMSSTDGITWSTCSMAAAIQWYSVTWSPELNLFAAVAITASGGNYAATSPDGVTWTMRALTTGNTWYSVTWASELGLFVAVGATGTNRAATSPDGVTWTLRAIQSAAWRRVVWSPELRLLVAVASGGQISTSPDGVTWTARTSPEANQWYEVVWSPDLMKFVVSGITGTSRILNSKEIGTITGNKLANYATPSNTAEQIIRRDQNGSFSATTVNATSALLNSGVAATNATLVNLNGHYKSTQTTAPTATVNANAGTGATCTVSNATDTAGTINLTTTAVAPAAGAQCAVNFNLTYNVAPKCVVSPESTNASLFAVANGTYFTTTTTTLVVNYTNADAAGHVNNWTYNCFETQ